MKFFCSFLGLFMINAVCFSGTAVTANKPALQSNAVFRLDYHYGALNPWLFYETPLSNSTGLLVVFQGSTQGYAQIDLGPVFHMGNLQLIPQIGVEFLETRQRGTRIGHVVPEFYIIYNNAHFSFESWNLYFIKVDEYQISSFLFRNHFAYHIYKNIFIGPQLEGNVFEDRSIVYAGGHLDLNMGIGTMGFFYGQDKDDQGLVRLTFIKPF